MLDALKYQKCLEAIAGTFELYSRQTALVYATDLGPGPAPRIVFRIEYYARGSPMKLNSEQWELAEAIERAKDTPADLARFHAALAFEDIEDRLGYSPPKPDPIRSYTFTQKIP